MNIKKFKKFIALFSVSIIMVSFLLPHLNRTNDIIAATIRMATTAPSEGESENKPHGFKIENAEYWDYNKNYDKYRIYIDQGGGGNGGGGGAGGNQAQNAGNSGNSDLAGGMGGQAAGTGTGLGDASGMAGVGGANAGSGSGTGMASGTNGNSGSLGDVKISNGGSGSQTADALRALKQSIEESRAESIALEIAKAKNAEYVRQSIEAREREQESIQKKIIQESIKNKVYGKENGEMRPHRLYPKYEESLVPTAAPNQNINIIDQTFYRAPSSPVVSAQDMYSAQIDRQYSNNVSAPTFQNNQTYYEDNNIMPTASAYDEPLIREEEVFPGISRVGPGEFIETMPIVQTLPQGPVIPIAPITPVVPYVAPETVEVLTPTAAPKEIEETITPKAPEIETPKAEGKIENVGESIVSETSVENPNNEDAGKGSKGGHEAGDEEDKKGDNGIDESLGNAEDNGKAHIEQIGKNKGKKVFEIDTNGYIGLNEPHVSLNERTYTFLCAFLILALGFVAFFIESRDKRSRKNYF